MFTLPECDHANLTEPEQQLFLLIFLLGKTNAYTLAQALHTLPQASGFRPVHMKEPEVERLLGGLKRAGLVHTAAYGFVSVAPISLSSQRMLFALPQTQACKAAVERAIRSSTYEYSFACLCFSSEGILKPYYLVHEALLSNNVSAAEDLRRGKFSQTNDRDWQAFCKLLAEPVVREPASVAPAVVFHLFENLAETALKRGLPSGPLTAVLTAHVATLGKPAFSPQKFLALCAWATWTASRDLLKILSSKASNPLHTEALAACAALLAGDWPTADKVFAKTLRLLKDYSEDGSVGACGNFFLLAALALIRANVSQTRVRSLINKLNVTDYHSDNYLTRMGLSLFALNEIANQGSLTASPPPPRKRLAPLDGFVRALESLFLEEDGVDKSVRQSCAVLLADAHREGYAFMAASLVPCVRRLCPDDFTIAETCRLIEAAKAAAPLWAAPHVVAAWEHALTEIENLLPKAKGVAPAADPSAGRTHQLVWLVGFRGKGGDDLEVRGLECRLQKRLKSGAWSAGTNLSLEKICTGECDAHLDEADRPVKDALIRNLPRYGYSSYYSYSFESAYRILPALVGHPRVYTPKDADYVYLHQAELIPARIERGEPAVDIAASNGQGTKIRIPWLTRARYPELSVACERPGVYTVYVKSRTHQRLAEIVSKYGDAGSLAIPAEGTDTLKRLIPSLAQVVGVKGEFDTESVSARTVAGGVCLHLRAQFVGEVMHFDLKNQPAPEVPLVVTPGHGAHKVLARHNGETVAVARDLKAESEAFRDFLDACPGLGAWSVTETHWEVEEFSDILDILNAVHALADRVSLDWPEGGEIAVVRPNPTAPFNLTAEAGADFWLEVGGEVALDNGKVLAFTELLAKLGDRTGAFVRLNDRQFLRLTQSLARQMELLARAGEATKKTLSVPPSAVALLDALASGKEALDFPTLVRDRIADFRRAFKTVAPVPTSMTCELRPYQRDGFVWLAKLAACGLGACLADDMGLGKTVQILALLTARASDGPSLVIAPTSVIRNWADEAARFAPALRFAQLSDAEDRSRLVADAGSFDVVVCSYGLLPFEENLLAGREWNVVVLDEAQAVKNHLAKRTKIVKRFRGRTRVIATGTPVENNLTELWSLFDFINPGLLGGTHGQFERRFCNSDGTVGPVLKRMTAPFILRRLKSAVLDDLPPKTEITLSVTLDEDERALYESCRREALDALEGVDGEANRIAILAHLTKLRRACCHPSLVMPDCGMPGQKVESLLELVQDLRANGHRALVFSQFVDFLSIIRKRFDAAGITYQYLDGSTPVGQRADAVSRFQRGEGDLFLISLKAGGTGLNLTAANYVVLLDPWWNPAVETQAADRAHRIGQRNPVTVYRLVTADTVEERVVALHAKKLALAEAILDDTADTRLSANDLLALFKA
jgi:hypothetical protein